MKAVDLRPQESIHTILNIGLKSFSHTETDTCVSCCHNATCASRGHYCHMGAVMYTMLHKMKASIVSWSAQYDVPKDLAGGGSMYTVARACRLGARFAGKLDHLIDQCKSSLDAVHSRPVVRFPVYIFYHVV